MSTISKTEFIDVFVEAVFTDSASITFDLPTDNITNVIPSIEFESININFTTTTVTVSGKYDLEVFDQVAIKYIERGSSDIIQTPIIVDNFEIIDANTNQVFDYQPDNRNLIVISYNIITTDTNFVVTQNVFNNYSIGRDKLGNYT
jgi:hypothetical protein